jgi:hypothetical protein
VQRIAFLFLLFIFPFISKAQIVSDITAQYHNGQVFIIWKNVEPCDTGFYYVYRDTVPITNENIKTSKYLGRVLHNFGYDYRLSYSIADVNYKKYYLVVNDTPNIVLDSTQNMFVTNCTKEGGQYYYAVRNNFGSDTANWKVVADSNATSVFITEHLDPVKCYLQYNQFPIAGEFMDIYIHYGGNISTSTYPALANEGCLAFHFGIVKTGAVDGKNYCYQKFHGGNGNFIANSIGTKVTNSWKISFDDWIPAYGLDSTGYNTRWFGYSEKLDIYSVTDDFPTAKNVIIKAYTYYRIKWENKWVQTTWPNAIDTTKLYLVGSSQGCAAVLVNSMIDPHLYAAGNLSDGKFNISAPDDSNPECKYNGDGAGILETRIYWGHEDSTNLPTDIPLDDSSNNFYHIFDLTNCWNMFHYNRNKSLPFLFAVNGKEDETACWEEKIPMYDTIQTTHAGGKFEWDLRGHGGGQITEWPALSIPELRRFRNNLSYPAFAYGTLNGYPGSGTFVDSPYYNGDPIGSINANYDWVDSSIVDQNNLWQIQLFITKKKLNSGKYIPAALPEFSTTDITLRRTQQFKGFAEGTKLCWMNFYHGELIQSGTVIQEYDTLTPRPITVQKVKVYPDGNVFRVVPCDSLQPTGFLPPEYLHDNFSPHSFQFKDDRTLLAALNNIDPSQLEYFNYIGEKINLSAGISSAKLPEGIYFVKWQTETSTAIFKIYKS